VDIALLLVQHGADTTARADDGSTPLDLALQHDHVGLARFLVEHGADTTAYAMPQIQQQLKTT
jgi:ankyrin repeat protein